MSTYYNENDPKAAAWLRELIKENLIAPGDVDERSIEDVVPSEIKKYTQCHFFAGIGGWSLALRKAGWADDVPVWTGSCPCQPFSSAGKGKGTTDERHLWPAFFWLIKQCRPNTIFGEQVAGKAGETWLDVVSSDMENEGYSFGVAITAACGFGAPHQRKRIYFVADTKHQRSQRGLPRGKNKKGENKFRHFRYRGTIDNLADSDSRGLSERGETSETSRYGNPLDPESGTDRYKQPGPTNGFWRDADWIYCRDGKWRPVEPGTSALANGVPARVGRLCGYGNAIVIPQAQAFIESFMEIRHESCPA